MEKNTRNTLILLLFISLISIILFIKPILSSKPLGLDAGGHLSKISYLKTYPFANWDMSWYSGTTFLKMYSPLFYYIAALFPNSILAINFLSFLSILFCALGIFLLVNYLTKDKLSSIISSISFLSVLSLSYYYLSVGNHPWVSGLWAIPFSIYFLEKSLKQKKKKDFVIYSIIFALGILIHVLIGFIIGLLMILRIIVTGINKKNIKTIFQYGIIPVLLSSFWFFPFLMYQGNFSGGYVGYTPKALDLFGFNNTVTWGYQAGGIGILMFLFILSLFFLKKIYKQKEIQFLLLSILVLGFILFGGLMSNYPQGVSAVRFILPFSILLSIYTGLAISKSSLPSNKLFLIVISLILILGLIWNATIINKNYEQFSYNKEDSRYQIFQNIIQEDFPIKNEYTNYRFGTSKFIFGENLNYFMPKASQTFGYQDAGMLNAPRYYDMRWNIWLSEDINDSIYWLDWFGIKYFEVENKEFVEKFENDSRFKTIKKYNGFYEFTLFEYINAKQIISLVDYIDINNSKFGKEKDFIWERNHPDKIKITYNSIDSDDVILIKEFYHKSWKAKDISTKEKLEIFQANPGFMIVYPNKESTGIILYQTKTLEEYVGIIFTIIGIIILIKKKTFIPQKSFHKELHD